METTLLVAIAGLVGILTLMVVRKSEEVQRLRALERAVELDHKIKLQIEIEKIEKERRP